MKMKMKMQNRSYRYNIDRHRSRQGHKYIKSKVPQFNYCYLY